IGVHGLAGSIPARPARFDQDTGRISGHNLVKCFSISTEPKNAENALVTEVSPTPPRRTPSMD
ncbi:MAG: hypothetical protein ACKO9Q_21230, partial [Pirellula sp.]